MVFKTLEEQEWLRHLVDRELGELVVEDMRVNDRMMTIKLVTGESTLNVNSSCAPQVGLNDMVKKLFWEDLEECEGYSAYREAIHWGGT